LSTLNKEDYKDLSDLTEKQQEAVCDLLSATISTTIFEFLEMFKANHEKFQI